MCVVCLCVCLSVPRANLGFQKEGGVLKKALQEQLVFKQSVLHLGGPGGMPPQAKFGLLRLVVILYHFVSYDAHGLSI